MPRTLDDILLYQARILQRTGAATRAADMARLQEIWLQASLDALQTLDIHSGEKVVVRSVPDGDGIKLADGRRVRYLGVHAPEVANYGRPAEPLAREARDFNRLLLSKGSVVIIPNGGANKDKYGRLLRHVFVNGRWINAALALTGLARSFLFADCHPAIAKWLQECENHARHLHLGLWSYL